MNIELHDGREPVLLRYNDPNFELCWRGKVKDRDTGEESLSWEPKLYFMSPAQALSRLLTMRVGNSDARTLTELREVIEHTASEIMGAYSTLITKEDLKNVNS